MFISHKFSVELGAHHAQNQSAEYALTLSFIGNNDKIIVLF